jgi:hypothetical protein
MTEKGKEATLFERRPDSAVLASSSDMYFWLNSQSAADNNFFNMDHTFTQPIGDTLRSSSYTSDEHDSYHPEPALGEKSEDRFYFRVFTESTLAASRWFRHEKACAADPRPHLNALAEPQRR